MPDITEQILAEINPLYNPLPPTVDETLTEYRESISGEIAQLWEYFDDLEYEGNQITIEWATRELRGHQMGWVRVGLVADRVRRYRLYRGKFPDWKTYCQEVLGKKSWQVNKTIKCALAVMALIDWGDFEIIPSCISQVDKLLACCQKSGQLLVDAWQTVTETLPEAFLITANSISEVLGFPVDYGNRIPKRLCDRLREVADRDGMTIEEKIEELLYLEEVDTECATDDGELEETEVSEDQEQAWREDMNQLVTEHDRQLWFLGAIAKMFKPISSSQFSWLRQVRYQT